MFPGATVDREIADYVLLGAPLGISTSFEPGTRFGPNQIHWFVGSFDDYDQYTDQFFIDLRVHDAGDVRAWDNAPEYVEWFAGNVRDAIWDDAVPVVIGGEHTVTAADVTGVDPDVFVCLDAHLDLRHAYDGNEWNHATVICRILDELGVDETVTLGARTGSLDEWECAAVDDVTVVEPEAVPDWESAFDGNQSVYLSVDIDAADSAFAPGTGTTELFGLISREMRDVVRTVAPHTDGLDVVEVNDRDGGQAASLTAKLLREFVFAYAAGRS